MVEVDHLTKRYGEVAAISDVSFDARDGEILAFLGKNGAGKTTTMRIMTGFMPPSSGTVRVNGFDIREDSLDARRQIGYLPETAPLYEDMSVRSYLEFCARLRQVSSKEVSERVETVLEAVHVSDRRNWLIGKLSKGLRRRVGLAQALVHNPKVLILDEPTEGLDPEQIIEIRHLIQGLRGDRTVILSTHILPEAQAMADRVVIIDEGRIVAVDTTENLTATARNARRLRVEIAGPVVAVRDRLKAFRGVISVEDASATEDSGGVESAHPRFIVESELELDLREGIAAMVVQTGWGLLELEPLEPTLEDVFLRLTAHARTEVARAPARALKDEETDGKPDATPEAVAP